MPNWCHNTLTVSGEADELAVFVTDAAPSEALLRSWWRKAKAERFQPEKRTFKVYAAAMREQQPLSFDAIVPEDAEWISAYEAEVSQSCEMCGGIGTLPESPEQALVQGAKWYEWMARREDRSCNVCAGKGQHVPFGREGWYTWRVRNWGCKWDASFGEPFMALGQDGADVDACIESKRATITPTVAIYKFDTPWAPPVPFVERASELYPNLEFVLRFGEPGEGYAGEARYVSGVCVAEEELEVEEVLAPEEMWF